MRQCCVAVLGKGVTIPCGLRLALAHLGGSEFRKIRWSGVLGLDPHPSAQQPEAEGGHGSDEDQNDGESQPQSDV